MSDNKDKSRADDLFDILNDLDTDDTVSKTDVSPETDNEKNNTVSCVDEMLEMLNQGRTTEFFIDDTKREPEDFPSCSDTEEGGDMPSSFFDHLSDEGDIPTPQPPITEGNPHFTEVIAQDDDDLDDDDDFDDDDFDDERYERVTKVGRVGRFFKGMSFIPKAIIYIVLVLIASAYLSYYVITIGNDVFALVVDSREVTITLEENATDGDVAKLLAENGVIEYDWVYELYMKYRSDGEQTQYIAGEHTLNTSFNYSQIITSLTSTYAERVTKRVTIPEGFTVDQIIDLLVSEGIGQRNDYIYAINEYPYKWEFVQQLDELIKADKERCEKDSTYAAGSSISDRKYRLEGYLYPDTYDFYTDTEEVYIINKMLNAFYDKFWKDFTELDDNGESFMNKMSNEHGLNFDDVIVLASMVQAEGGTPIDFYGVSYVFHNRLSHSSAYPRLESDATIQYVLPQRETDSSKIDISYPSPYNTYLYNGLPPGSICNPGLDALSATLFPEAPVNENDREIDAYFFVSNDAGKTYWAKTRDEHLKNTARVKEENQAIKDGTYDG